MGHGVTDPSNPFFTSPNEIVPSQLEGELAQLLDTLRTRFDRLGKRTLLPSRTAGVTRWYGLAPTPRDGHLLRDEIRCWLDRPLTSGRADVTQTTADPVDRLALDLVPQGAAMRVDVAPGWMQPVRRNVEALTTIWALEPDRGIDQPRPVGRILRQFYDSLMGNDRSQAEAALDELRGRAMISATNLRFLRVEMISSLGTPTELRDDPSLRDISLLARPRAVTESLADAADALVAAHLGDAPSKDDLLVAAKRIDAAWPTLVTHAYQVTTPATARCYALAQLLRDTPDERQVRHLSDQNVDDAVIAAVRAAITAPRPRPEAAVTTLSLYYDGEYEAAIRMADTPTPDRSSAAIALAAAVNMQDSLCASHALAIVDRLPSDDRSHLLEQAVEKSFFDRLQAMTAQSRIPQDWVDWLCGEWPDRPDLLADWSQNWPRTPDYLEATAEDLATNLIDAFSDARRPRVRNGVPLLVEWLTEGGIPPSGIAFGTTIFDIILSSEPGRTERQASLVLMEEILAAGCTSSEYTEILDAVARALHVIGPRDAPWLTQVIDLLLTYAAPRPEDREGVIVKAASVARGWAERIDPSDALVLGILFNSARTEFTVDNQDGARTSTRPFKTIGVYSMMENAIQVVTKWISERWPEVTVRASSEADSSKMLISLVQSVDVMLVQTSRAKHAATAAIDAAITDRSRLVYVNGRGASSLMRALLDWTDGPSD